MILDKDPFGYDYMMYRIRNKCEEVDELDYEDGLWFYYFYTGGNKGGNDQIKTMLRYIRNSREENATDSATKKIHKLAEKAKIHPEVRKSYMLWEEYVYLLKKELRPEVKEEVWEEVRKENEKAAEEFDRFIELVQILTNGGRSNEISKAASDPDYRERLYRENNLV